MDVPSEANKSRLVNVHVRGDDDSADDWVLYI